MGKGTIAIRGGGCAGKAYAIIHATYPEASTCTCTNGAKTLNAKGTNGVYIFPIPEAGEWTVTSGDKSQTVNITEKGQVEIVNLDVLYIVKDGEIKVDVSYNGMNGTVADGILTIKQTVAVRDAPVHANFGPVDLTNFNTLHVEMSDSSINTEYTNTVGVATAKNSNSPKAKANLKNADTADKSIDVSSFSGFYYVVFRIETGDTKRYVKTPNIWFE